MKKFLLTIFYLLFFIFYLSLISCSPINAPPDDSIGIDYDEAKEIVYEIITGQDENPAQVAYLWPEKLQQGDVVSSWDNDPTFPEDYQKPVTIERDTWLAWIDMDPENPFFGHDTKFVYINANNGEYAVQDQIFWPTINGVAFEGESDQMILQAEDDANAFNFNLLKKEDIAKLFNIDVYAEEAKSRLNIEPPDTENGEKREYYAFIVSGYGKNTWVFLEGAHQMYEKLIEIGYKPENIVFIGPGKKKLDPNWNKEGRAQLLDSDLINDYTSPGTITNTLNGFSGNIPSYRESLGKELGPTDSLFIFILAHGKKGYLASGQQVSKRKKIGSYDIRKGESANLSMNNFAKASIGEMEICELMILYDTCHSGSYQKFFDRLDDRGKSKPKRTAMGFSTNAKTKSYGADYSIYVTKKKYQKITKIYVADLDNGAPKTPEKDRNPNDIGGEFSSGFIAGMTSGLFKSAYDTAVKYDAAYENGLTEPSYRYRGTTGPCMAGADAGLTPPDGPGVAPDDDEDTEDEPQDEPEEETTKKITVITIEGKNYPYDQFKPFTGEHCDCCGGETHYHARNGSHVTSLDGHELKDPGNECGYGTIFDLSPKTIEVPK